MTVSSKHGWRTCTYSCNDNNSNRYKLHSYTHPHATLSAEFSPIINSSHCFTWNTSFTSCTECVSDVSSKNIQLAFIRCWAQSQMVQILAVRSLLTGFSPTSWLSYHHNLWIHSYHANSMNAATWKGIQWELIRAMFQGQYSN